MLLRGAELRFNVSKAWPDVGGNLLAEIPGAHCCADQQPMSRPRRITTLTTTCQVVEAACCQYAFSQGYTQGTKLLPSRL